MGCISFGGPAGQIAILHQELVVARRWISEQRFLHALNYCMVLPGPEAQQLATYLGWLLHGTRGALVAGSLFVLPSFFILVSLSWAYVVWGSTPVVASMFYGIKPVVVAIVAAAAWRIGTRACSTAFLASVAALSFGLTALAGTPFPAILAIAALLGWAASRFVPAQIGHGAVHETAAGGPGDEFVIGDSSPTPEHARAVPLDWLPTLLIGAGLWLLVLGAVVYAGGGLDGTLARMALFFSKAALLTFGGAYAVLPYVFDAAVARYSWLTPGQVLDGLALGETTPGPLIMVVTFIGFVGAWGQAPFGPEHLLAGALAAAAVVTFCTFLPSFLFILIGAPLVERTRDALRVTAPLRAITAAVVGVIANLALVLGEHALIPGTDGDLDWVAAAIALAAGVALLRFRLGVPVLVVAGALLGLGLHLLRA